MKVKLEIEGRKGLGYDQKLHATSERGSESGPEETCANATLQSF